jgi:hypothetical protein
MDRLRPRHLRALELAMAWPKLIAGSVVRSGTCEQMVVMGLLKRICEGQYAIMPKGRKVYETWKAKQ